MHTNSVRPFSSTFTTMDGGPNEETVGVAEIKSINQSTNQSINQSFNQSINQSIDQSINQ